MGFLHSLRVVIWGEPPDTKAERRLLFKIDFFILTYVCLMYWVSTRASDKIIENASLNNAHRSITSTGSSPMVNTHEDSDLVSR